MPTMVKGIMTSDELSAALVNAPKAFWDFQEGLEKDAGSRGVSHRLTYWTVYAIVMVTLWRGIVRRLTRLFYVIGKLWRSFLGSWCVGGCCLRCATFCVKV